MCVICVLFLPLEVWVRSKPMKVGGISYLVGHKQNCSRFFCVTPFQLSQFIENHASSYVLE